MNPTLGFIGLGSMGGPMCANLAAGYPVSAFDIDAEAVARAVDAGAAEVRSAAECAARSDVLLTSLRHPHDVEAVMREAGALAALRPGSLWIDLTTNRVELMRELAAEAPNGVSVIDSPVTGAVDGARSGTLTLFAGGSRTDVGRATPILDTLGLVIHCGELGSGNVVKLVTNQLWFIHAAALGEAFALGMANGVELDTLWHAITESVADSFVARHDAPSVFAGHYDPSFPLDICLKDLGLIADLEHELASTLTITAAARAAFSDAADRYGREAGEMHVVKRLEDDNGLDMRVAGDWTPPWEA